MPLRGYLVEGGNAGRCALGYERRLEVHRRLLAQGAVPPNLTVLRLAACRCNP